MSDICPYCGVSGDQEKVCKHYLFSIWEENFEDLDGAPVWMPMEIGEYAFEIKKSLDLLYAEISNLSNWPLLDNKKSPICHLMNNLKKRSKKNWQQDYDSLPRFIRRECNREFNEYVAQIYELTSPEKNPELDVIATGPGLSWEIIYFWSKNPKETCLKMIQLINEDTKIIQQINCRGKRL